MRNLIIYIFLFLSLTGASQDGLTKWIDTDSVDTFISIYNSPYDTRVEISKLFYDEIMNGVIKAESFNILLDNSMVIGETFITISENYILFDIYIDKVIYKNGNTYTAERFIKPKGPIDYTKF